MMARIFPRTYALDFDPAEHTWKNHVLKPVQTLARFVNAIAFGFFTRQFTVLNAILSSRIARSDEKSH